MKSAAFVSESIEELKHNIAKHTEDGFQPTIAICFSSICQDMSKVGPVFSDFGIPVMGCSTAGEICNDDFIDRSLVSMLLDIKQEQFQLFTGENDEKRSTYQIAFDLGKEAISFCRNPALIILSAGMQVVAEDLLRGVQDAVGRPLPLYGGMAGDDANWVQTFAFNNDKVIDHGMMALILDGDYLEVKGLATSGWEPIGLENTITKGCGNTIYTINDEPALDVFIRYFGTFDNTMVKGEDVSSLSAQYPLQILREGGSEPILRSPIIGNDQERSLTLAGYIKEGERFRFSLSPGLEVIEKTVENFQVFQKQDAVESDALILFSCKGRHAALGPMMEDEVSGIHQPWGNTPMIGFLCYGEFG
ncbi:MAG: FIST N-terminal domain-containing protein, partial [Bacteroidota bacterium]